MQRYTVYLYLETALHVSGGTSTHHQERLQLYLQHLVFVTPLLLSAATVEELEPVWVCSLGNEYWLVYTAESFNDNPTAFGDHRYGWSHGSSNSTSCNCTSSLFRYLNFITTSAESPLSQTLVARKIVEHFTGLSDISGFWEWARRASASCFVWRSVTWKLYYFVPSLLCQIRQDGDVNSHTAVSSPVVSWLRSWKVLVKLHLEDLRMFAKWLRHFRRV
jgi:hypothetical protein